MFPEGGVRHYVDCRSTVDKHLGQWLAINVSSQVQRPHMSILGRFVENCLLGQHQLCHHPPDLLII
jgi:hypothetical protein